MERDQYRFGLGSIGCVVFNDFTNTQPFAQLIAGVSEDQLTEAMRKEGLPTNGALLDTNVWLFGTGGRTVLIDSGWGAEGSLLRNMQVEGISPTDIDMVIITHTDGDHTGGLLDEQGALSFPNAQYAISRPAWTLWTSDAYLGELPDHRADSVRQASALMQDHTRMLDVDSEILPGVRVVDAPGHREGHIALVLSSEGEEMLHVADGILHPIFIMHPSWHSPIDSNPAGAAETRRELLSRAAENNMLVASAHLPFPGLGRVIQKGKGWQWQPIT